MFASMALTPGTEMSAASFRSKCSTVVAEIWPPAAA